MTASENANPMQKTVRWLSSFTNFPGARLESRAETLLLIAALAEADNDGSAESPKITTEAPAIV